MSPENTGNKLKPFILILALGALLFIPYLGAVHLFDWDEINFAEAAREMIETGDYFTVRIDYEAFHEKPPLFFWLQVIAMKVFGVNEFASRLPNALIGIATLMFIFHVGKKLFDEKMGIIWVLAYAGSFLPHFYFRSGIIDPLFNIFIFAGIYQISEFNYKYNYQGIRFGGDNFWNVFTAGILIGMATMTKGPVGYMLPALTWGAFALAGKRKNSKRRSIGIPWKAFIIFSLVAFAVPIAYYAYVYLLVDSGLVEKFISYQIRLLTTGDAGHSGPIYYHLVILLIGCFPASVFALRGFTKKQADISLQSNFKEWNIILLIVVVVIFSIVKTKIVHYSSLAYFPITFLAAYSLWHIIYREEKWKASTSWILGIFGVVWGVLFAGLPLILMNTEMILPKITDEFTAGLLSAEVGWQGYEPVFGAIYLAAVIACLIFFARKKILQGSVIIFASTAILIFAFLPTTAPKIEQYTQGAPIEFYKSKQGEDCYVYALGFKSYAQHFYTMKKFKNSRASMDLTDAEFRDWLLFGDIDKPAYFVTKNKKAEKYLVIDGVEKLYDKNGWVFMMRDDPK